MVEIIDVAVQMLQMVCLARVGCEQCDVVVGLMRVAVCWVIVVLFIETRRARRMIAAAAAILTRVQYVLL